jgi:two-component system LytT family response regulator
MAGTITVIRVLIADDEKPARDKLARSLAAHADTQVVGLCCSGAEAARDIAAYRPDVAFLDIQMPEMSGLEVAAQLEAEDAPLVVFVTAFDEYAVRAFELNAVDYLLKPYDAERLAQSLSRVRERVNDRAARLGAVSTARSQIGSPDRLLVPQGELLRLIDTSLIESLEADDNYVHVRTHERSYLLRRTLQDLLLQLGDRQFVRIHKSAAVNLSAVQSFTPLFKGDYDVKLASGRELRMSRRFKDVLFARLGR